MLVWLKIKKSGSNKTKVEQRRKKLKAWVQIKQIRKVKTENFPKRKDFEIHWG